MVCPKSQEHENYQQSFKKTRYYLVTTMVGDKSVEAVLTVKIALSPIIPSPALEELAQIVELNETLYGLEAPRWVANQIGERRSGGCLAPYNPQVHTFVKENELERVGEKLYYPNEDIILEILSPRHNIAYAVPLFQNRMDGAYYRLLEYLVVDEEDNPARGGGFFNPNQLSSNIVPGRLLAVVTNGEESRTVFVDDIEVNAGILGAIRSRRLIPENKPFLGAQHNTFLSEEEQREFGTYLYSAEIHRAEKAASERLDEYRRVNPDSNDLIMQQIAIGREEEQRQGIPDGFFAANYYLRPQINLFDNSPFYVELMKKMAQGEPPNPTEIPWQRIAEESVSDVTFTKSISGPRYLTFTLPEVHYRNIEDDFIHLDLQARWTPKERFHLPFPESVVETEW